MVGPVDDIIGERFVCVFPKGSEDWTTSFAKKVPAGLADAVAASGVQPPFAAAVNLQFVPRTRYAQTPLQAGDQVELISPVTGG